jgi:hypothetical protein
LVFWIGLYPKPLLDVMHASVARVIASQSTSVVVQQETVMRDHTVLMTVAPSERPFPFPMTREAMP